MEVQNKDVSAFFNQIAGEYREKYGNGDVFHSYFFNERLEEASRGFDLNGARILDVGAGTGNLYDFLLERYPNIDYYATDIAGDMLNQSRIPVENRQVGRLEDVIFVGPAFNYVYVLGVSTYLDRTSMLSLLDRISELCLPGSKVIITFTNNQSLDWKIRRLLKRLPLHLISKRYVMSQDFTVFARSVHAVNELVCCNFVIDEVRWLNHTVFPFNQLFKGPSVALAKKLHKSKNTWMKFFSSDFLLVMTKKMARANLEKERS